MIRPLRRVVRGAVNLTLRVCRRPRVIRPLRRLVRRAVNLTLRVCRRLRVFPFSLGYAVLSAVVRWRGLVGSERLARVGEAKGAASPLGMLIWLDRIAGEVPGRVFDACVRLSLDAEDDRLHDLFSVLLASPRLRSLALYWDEERLLEDLPLLQSWRDRAGASSWSSVRDDLTAPAPGALGEFLAGPHEPMAVPVAARREAETLLKRLAGGVWVVCLNLPPGITWLTEKLARALPDARFFDFQSAGPASAGSSLPLGGFGLSLHERLAVVGAADAYVGRFDELGGAAIVAGRPAVLLRGEDAIPDERLGASETFWVGRCEDLTPATAEQVVRFLRGRWAEA